MSLATWAFPLEESQNNNNMSTNVGQGSLRGNNKARTLKNRGKAPQQSPGTGSAQLQDLKNSVYGEAPEAKSTGAASGLGDFVPHPESIGAERRAERDNSQRHTQQHGPAPVCELDSGTDGPCSAEGFDDLANSRINDYYARTVPMYQDNSVK